MKRSKEITFFQTEVVGESLSIATENLCPGQTYCGQLPVNKLLPSVVKFVE